MTIERVNERELLSAAMQGSQVAYRELLHLHLGSVYRFAWALIGEEDAQTVTENAFITTWQQLPYLKSLNTSFRDRLLHLVCIDCAELAKRQRRHRVNMPAAQDEDALNFPFGPLRYDPRTNMEHLALQTDIEEAIRTLPFHFRRILLLHEMGDLADTQIADITDSTAEAIHTDLQRAQSFVRRQIILGGGFFPVTDQAGEKVSEPKYRACKAYLPTLSAAADDLCTNSEKQMLSAHLSQCPGCQGYYDSLRAIHHGIAVMKCDVPGGMESYIMHRIQQNDNGSGSAASAKKHTFHPVFGRFTIIALCIALVLLAYSNGILGNLPPIFQGGEPQTQQENNTPADDSNQQSGAQTPQTTPEQTPQADDADQPDPETQEPPASQEDTPPADNDNGDGGSSSIIPGGSTSSTLVPEGESYCSIYTTDASAVTVLAQYALRTFNATLESGQEVSYYVIASENEETVCNALDSAAVAYTSYTGDDTAVDPAQDNLLFIVYLA